MRASANLSSEGPPWPEAAGGVVDVVQDRPSPWSTWAAPVAISVVLTLAALLVAPRRALELGPSASFLPAVLALIVMVDLISTYLLVQQFREEGDLRTLASSWAYVWSLVVVAGYAGAFPGVMVHPPLATAPSVAPWLYVAWHAGFPILLGAAWAPWLKRFRSPCPRPVRDRLALASLCGWAAAAILFVAFVVARGPALPVLIQGLDTSQMSKLTAPVALPLVVVSVLSTAYGLRGRTGPERWTVVAVWICLLDLLLTYSSMHRFSLGWYTGRTLSVVAASVVLLAMLHETTAIKRQHAAVTKALEAELAGRALLKAELARSEEMFRTAFDSALVGMWLTTPEGRFKRVNNAFAQMLGRTVDALEGMRFMEIAHPTQDPETERIRRRVLSGDHPGGARVRVRLVHADGSIVHAELSSQLIRDAAGEPVQFVGQILDLTSREQAEAERDAQRYMLMSVISNSQSLIYVKDLEGRYLLANDMLRTTMGRSEAEILGRTDLELTANVDPAWAAAEVRARTWEQHDEHTVTRANGDVVIYEVVRFPLLDVHGRVYGTCGISLDVTARRQLATQKEAAARVALDASQSKERFLTTISSEIRTKMAAVMGMTDLLAASNLDEYQADLVSMIRSSSDALTIIADTALDYRRLNPAGPRSAP